MSHALLRDALLVTGSLNAKEDDRTLDRSQIHPVQLVTTAGAQPLSYFDEIGDLGVSALALRPGSLRLFYTEGTDLFELDLATGTRTPHPIPRLRDVHEIEFIGDTLWLSNTGYDEAVGYHPDTGATQREQLRRTEPHADPVIEELAAGQSDVSTIDRFHCNQVFEGYDGHRSPRAPCVGPPARPAHRPEAHQVAGQRRRDQPRYRRAPQPPLEGAAQRPPRRGRLLGLQQRARQDPHLRQGLDPAAPTRRARVGARGVAVVDVDLGVPAAEDPVGVRDAAD
ncbi:MAG: hypothetical protein AAFN13_07690, partial [Bacteroidota bacterium]